MADVPSCSESPIRDTLISQLCRKKQKYKKDIFCIRETLNISTCVNISTDKRYINISFFTCHISSSCKPLKCAIYGSVLSLHYSEPMTDYGNSLILQAVLCTAVFILKFSLRQWYALLCLDLCTKLYNVPSNGSN